MFLPIPFGLVPTTPTDAPTEAFPTLTDVASLLPLSLAEQLAPTTSNPTPPRYFTSWFPIDNCSRIEVFHRLV
jgi:hypothetical protein